MHRSPWSSYGRPSAPAEATPPKADPTLGAAAQLARGREQLDRYLQRTLKDYADIRAGRRGYQRLLAEALRPSPRPESIEERLRRLGDE
jgi:hypothetical protein